MIPQAAMTPASAMKRKNDGLGVESSRARASTSSHTRASPASPGVTASARIAASESDMSRASMLMAPS